MLNFVANNTLITMSIFKSADSFSYVKTITNRKRFKDKLNKKVAPKNLELMSRIGAKQAF